MNGPSSNEAPEQTGNPGSWSAGSVGAVRRVGLVGAGYIADWHAQGLRSVENVELVAVCDRAMAKAQTMAAKFDVAQVYGSLKGMLAAEKLDAVHILRAAGFPF